MNALPSDDKQTSQPQTSSVGIAKENEPTGASSEPSGLKEVGQDVALPKEVAAAGVRMQPTTVAIPAPVTKLGVKPVGQAAVSPSPTVALLPLSDDQIAQGLTQSVTTSWRWLAEWCKKRLKQLRLIK